MQASQHGQIVSFIWRIADDVLRDVFVRGKYRDVILPMTVIRRLDAVLEPTKEAVFAQQKLAEQMGIKDPDQMLKAAATKRGDTAQPVVKKLCYSTVEYEPDPELRDTEQIPLVEPGGIAGFMEREVLPHVPDAWLAPGSEKIGYEISFARYLYKPQQLRILAEIEADIRVLERESGA